MACVLCVQHMNCWLQHLLELFDFPLCLKNCFFFQDTICCTIILFGSQNHKGKKNKKSTMVRILEKYKSLYKLIKHTQEKWNAVFWDNQCNSSSQSIVKSQGHLTKDIAFSKMKTCVFVINMLCARLHVSVSSSQCVFQCVCFFNCVTEEKTKLNSEAGSKTWMVQSVEYPQKRGRDWNVNVCLFVCSQGRVA